MMNPGKLHGLVRVNAIEREQARAFETAKTLKVSVEESRAASGCGFLGAFARPRLDLEINI